MYFQQASLPDLQFLFIELQDIMRRFLKTFRRFVVKYVMLVIFKIILSGVQHLHRLLHSFFIHQDLQSTDADQYIFRHILSLFIISCFHTTFIKRSPQL